MAAAVWAVRHWPDWFRSHYGVAWPRTYCCVDVETTGLVPGQDVVVQWGHCLVEDGVVADRLGLVLDWTGRDRPPGFWLADRLGRLAEEMAAAGLRWHVPFDRLRSEGRRPEEALAFVAGFVDRLKRRGVPFVLHDHVFDEKMLSHAFLDLGLGPGFTFGDRLVDTAALEKAGQMAGQPRARPRPTDRPRDYFLRVKYTRADGVRYDLSGHCYDAYGFSARGLARTDLHDAEVDSFCCHLIVEAVREAFERGGADGGSVASGDGAGPPAGGGRLRRVRGQRRS